MKQKRMSDAAILRAAERIQARKDRKRDSEAATIAIQLDAVAKKNKWNKSQQRYAWMRAMEMHFEVGLEETLKAIKRASNSRGKP